jgi:hypothetical protein
MSAHDHVSRPDALRWTASQFLRTPNSPLFCADSALQWVSIYLLNLLAATLGVVVVTGFFLNIILKPLELFIGHATLFSIARAPYYALPLLIALAAGYASKHRWKSNHGYWVWILPALYLALNLILWKSSNVLASNTWGTALNHFFAGNPPHYPEQDVTIPFYTSVAYALGAMLKSCIRWI